METKAKHRAVPRERGADRSDERELPASLGGLRLELEGLLSELVDRAHETLDTQNRLRGLLGANQALLADVDLSSLLQRLTCSARELVGARYAALGVLDARGGLAEFIQEGVPGETVAQIGPLPRGNGLLGALIDDPQPMGSFLGVPVRIGDEVFGNLYFTDSIRGAFGPEDEELATALAATAALVIDNARHLETSRRRGDWLAATATVTGAMLAPETDQSPLQLIADHAYRLADADLVVVLLATDATPGQLKVATVAGGSTTPSAAAELLGAESAISDTVCGHVFTTGEPVRLDDATRHRDPPSVFATGMDLGPALIAPLTGTHHTRGVLAVARLAGRQPFRAEDLELAAAFADHASVAIELADGRRERERRVLDDERDRIAADLHDHIIQRLLGAGLALSGTATLLDDHPAGPRVAEVVRELDDAIAQIRTAVFDIQHRTSSAAEPATSTPT